jgi:hypothetical protein
VRCFLLSCAEECRSRYKDLVKLAGKQGLSELQLMQAAVDSCGCNSTVAAPVAQDDEAVRLKLLVSISLSSCFQPRMHAHMQSTCPVQVMCSAVPAGLCANATCKAAAVKRSLLICCSVHITT